MPPKKSGGPSKKTEEKKKQKIIEDKTFGLKNKNKSKAVQKYVQGVASQVKGGVSSKSMQAQYEKKKKEKEAEEREKMENALFKPVVVQQKAPVGVDPKSVVCEFFKKGLCTKGDKCKYSHNLEQGRKAEKIDLYTDRREQEEDTMDKWDQKKLETVVETKQTSENKNLKTKIVCKYFLDAIEQQKYGWFWECPNGGDKCQYQHCLPPGFVLKPKVKEEVEEEEPTPIEEIIEEERAQLTTRTPLTLELFLKWKEEKKKERDEKEKQDREKRENEVKTGKAMRSGREIFMYNPDLFVDDDDVLDTEELEPEEEDEHVINIQATGTSISLNITGNTNANKKGKTMQEEMEEDPFFQASYDEGPEDNNNNNNETQDVDELASKVDGVQVQEELFNEDDIPDEDEEEEEGTEQ
mmetsp:Transcript_22685/g.31586  ORF Transcript_22685/g.31586 Transcript_22685/m.31586 type:complete len:410 (-) Transcript_22685:42-1271(-)